MTPEQEKDAREALASLAAKGITGCTVLTSTSPMLPWIIVMQPQLQHFASYASAARQDPLMASIGLIRILTVASSIELEASIAAAPFAVMRVCQVLLQGYGLGASAEKKSLN